MRRGCRWLSRRGLESFFLGDRRLGEVASGMIVVGEEEKGMES